MWEECEKKGNSFTTGAQTLLLKKDAFVAFEFVVLSLVVCRWPWTTCLFRFLRVIVRQ